MSEYIIGTGVDGTTVPVGKDRPIMTRERWGNSRFIAGELFEDVMMRYLPLSINVVEIGSGWTTIVLSEEIAKRPILQVTSLEQMELWYEKVLPYAPNVSLYLAPMFPIGSVTLFRTTYEMEWYDLSEVFLPDSIDLLLVDGPVRKENHPTRYPAVPMLENFMAPGCKIILDDSAPNEIVAAGWQDNFDCTVVFHHKSDTEDVLVLEYPGPNQVVTETGEKGKACLTQSLQPFAQ